MALPTLILALVLACGPGANPVEEAAPATTLDVADEVVGALMAARTRCADGEYTAAAETIRAAYAGPFAALEPALRAHDPQATLELEYSFGRVAARAARQGGGKATGTGGGGGGGGKGGGDAVAVEVDALILDLREAVAALPAPPPVDGQPVAAPRPGAGLPGGGPNPEITTVPAN